MGVARLLKASDIAEMLQCSEYTVYEMAKDGRLPAIRIGRLVRFTESDMERFFQTLEARGEKDAVVI
jgi:excisionase family DNA binding protein